MLLVSIPESSGPAEGICFVCLRGYFRIRIELLILYRAISCVALQFRQFRYGDGAKALVLACGPLSKDEPCMDV